VAKLRKWGQRAEAGFRENGLGKKGQGLRLGPWMEGGLVVSDIHL
jgi:hypothetical protein